jgi:hypothetical protein
MPVRGLSSGNGRPATDGFVVCDHEGSNTDPPAIFVCRVPGPTLRLTVRRFGAGQESQQVVSAVSATSSGQFVVVFSQVRFGGL